MTRAKQAKLRDRIIALIKKINDQHIADRFRLGKLLRQYFEISDRNSVVVLSEDCYLRMVELFVGHARAYSRSHYRLAIRLSFISTLKLAKKLDASRVSWRKVISALSPSFNDAESLAWLEILSTEPWTPRDQIGETSYPAIRLPGTVEAGCIRLRRESLRTCALIKGVSARISDRRSARAFSAGESSRLSEAKRAVKELHSEIGYLIAEIDRRQQVLNEARNPAPPLSKEARG